MPWLLASRHCLLRSQHWLMQDACLLLPSRLPRWSPRHDTDRESWKIFPYERAFSVPLYISFHFIAPETRSVCMASENLVLFA